MQKTEMPEKFKKCAIRRRTKNEGSVSRPRKITVRATVAGRCNLMATFTDPKRAMEYAESIAKEGDEA